jgi:hypothetical protein
LTITAAGRGSIARICRIAVRRFSGCASPMWVSLRIAIVLRRCRIRR